MLKKLKMLFPKESMWLYLMTVLSVALILWGGITFKQEFYQILPLFVSLLIGVLQSKANRYAPLLGGLNCLLYTAVYVALGLYATAANTLLISCPLQIATFIRWNKRPYKQSTQFRSLSAGQWCIVAVIFVGYYLVQHFLLSAANSNFRILDNLSAVFSLFTAILPLLSFREYSWFMLGFSVTNIALQVSMLATVPSQITYVVYACHCFICMILQLISVNKLYKEQRAEKEVQ